MTTHPPYSREGTSHDAAHSIQEVASAIRERVFRLIRDGGRTCDECEALLDLRHQTASARINELQRAGRVVDSGKRRLTRSGRNAIIWIVPQPEGQGQLL